MGSGQRYEVRTAAVRRLRGAAGAVVPLVVSLTAVGAAVAVAGPDDRFGRVVLLGGLVAIGLALTAVLLAGKVRGTVELAVEEPGIRLAGAAVPWRSIDRVVVTAAPAADRVAVGIRLRPGTPLPDGLHGVVHDPRRPGAGHLRQRFSTTRLDSRRLAAAVTALAPPGVAVMAAPTPEPTLEPTLQPTPAPTPASGQRRETVAVVTGVRHRQHGRLFLRTSTAYHVRVKPHPVVSFTLPDHRQVLAETANPGPGEPGTRVVVSYDVEDPTNVRIHGAAPRGHWVRTP